MRRHYRLPERFVLFVGTLEPRKNLRRLADAARPRDRPAAAGRGRSGRVGRRPHGTSVGDVRFLGFVPGDDLPALYAAASVFAYPSEREGFGLPVVEAMAQGTPVVTSAGTATEEVAGGAAVLVDPLDVDAIAAGLDTAHDAGRRAGECGTCSRRRADLGGDGRRDDGRLSRGARCRWWMIRTWRRLRRCRPARSSSASTCCGACPATWAGRRSTSSVSSRGLHEAAPDIRAELFVLPGFAAAHRDLAAQHEVVVASLDARRRSRRVLSEATWLPPPPRRCRRRAPRRRHGSAAVAGADRADGPRPAVPQLSRST